jgi:hypothetical protein
VCPTTMSVALRSQSGFQVGIADELAEAA